MDSISWVRCASGNVFSHKTMLKLFRYFAFCQKAWIKVHRFDCFLVFSCKCSLNFGSAKTSHWWISTPKNQIQCQQSKKRRSKVLAIKRQTFKSDVDLQVASSQMSSAGAVLARCCSQAATWCWRWRMIMVAMVNKPALFAFSGARLHQWKVLGSACKHQLWKFHWKLSGTKSL